MRALLAVLLLAPGVAAQLPGPPAALIDTAVTVAFEPASAQVRPLGAFETLAVRVTYAYLEVAPAEKGATIIVGATDFPPWAVATVSPSSLFAPAPVPPCGCQREVVLETFLLLTVTQDAPAFRPGTVTVAARAEPNGAYKGSEGNAEAEVVAAYFAKVEASTAQGVFNLRPGERRDAPVTVTNFGNGPSRITFRLQGAPPDITVGLPASFDLGARQAGAPQNSRTVDFAFTAGAAPQSGHATVVVEARSTEDAAAEGDTTLASFSIGVPGTRNPDRSPAPVPTPGAAEMALALGAAALLAARRRDVV